ncbi:hypothetical protein BCR32DRAFT_292449 [Anaeromyces robustus]|uniref:Rho GTPase activation protein n=1 Tax=Anaeromyces robustus TaxID=1754192 RepID=A0A1Y1XAH3_9FUNG|nr:hypothetical protein BCR32DRAFT_292449 [Anaeromyces robustus]|eukprot:ORX82729.1 hypothetical protein BCR32DRAFT_292449 [Anaeromyces robustus]
MSFENVYRYTNESINLCLDVLNFYKRKKEIEFEFSQALSNLCQTYKVQYNNIINQQQGTPELMIKSHLLQNTLWKTFINQIEEFDQIARYHRTLAVSYEDSIIQPLTVDVEEMEANQKKIVENGLDKVKILQDAYTELKKKREIYKEAQDQAKEAAEAHNKALSQNIKDKEMEKINAKYQTTLEKVNCAKDNVNACENICKKQQEKYFFSDLPVILENLKSKEEERCFNLKKLFIEANKIEKLSIQYIVKINSSVGEGLKDIDVAGDIEDLTQNYMYSFNHDTDISVRSLINPEKAGRMNVHKDTGSMEWRSRYFVLMEKHFRLYCFESEDSTQPREIIDLNDVSVHLLDDSYFNIANTFQVVVYNNIKEKSRKKAFVYYFVAESPQDRQEWFAHIRDIAYCCHTCNITKMILYEYNQRLHGKEIHNHEDKNENEDEKQQKQEQEKLYVLTNKVSELSDFNDSPVNSHFTDTDATINSNKTSISQPNSIISNTNTVSSANNGHQSPVFLTDQMKRTMEPAPLTMADKNSNVKKSLITFAEALDDPLIFLNNEDGEEPRNLLDNSYPNSAEESQVSLNKGYIKSPLQSQKSLFQNMHDDSSPRNSAIAQRFHEQNKDKKQNRYSASFAENSKVTYNTGTIRRDSSVEANMCNTGSNLKKDSSFFRMIKNNAKSLNVYNLFNSGSDESIDSLANDITSMTMPTSKQNRRYSIINNTSQSKLPNININSSMEDLNNMFEYLNDKNKYRINRNIRICVLEARNIFPNEKKKNLESYAFIFFDDIVQAKTSKQVGFNPFWGEEFYFENVLPCLSNIHIIVCQQHRVSNDSEIGHIIIPINKLHSNKKVEEWMPLIPINSNNENFNGSIRVCITLTDEHILPMEDYNEFINYVFEPSLEPVIRLGDVVQQREEFAKTLLYILMDKQQEVEGIKTLVSLEVKNTEDPNIIFRGNSLTTKIIDQYMKLIGSRYLNNTLRRQVQNVYNYKESCEVDPSKTDKSEDIKKHWKKLLIYVNSFWEAIRQSISKCPSKLKEIFSFTKTEVAKTFKNENTVQYSSISGFIFLRFFCPAILSPKLFGLAEQHPDPVTARTLTLIAKILQNLANLTEFASKEPHMSESNQFIKNHISEMKYFIDAIAIPPDKPEENSVVEYDVRSQCEKFYRFYRKNFKNCFNVNENPEDQKLKDIIDGITNIHRKYNDDLLNYPVSNEDKSIQKILNNSEISLNNLMNEQEEDNDSSSHMKKELSNYTMDEYTKNELDDSLKSIIYTIRRFSAQYNRRDPSRRQNNTINKISLNQYSPYIEDIFSGSQRTSIISSSTNEYNECECSTHSLNDINVSPTSKLNAHSHNSLNSNSTNSLHSNNSTNMNNNGHRSAVTDIENEDDDNVLMSLEEGLNLGNILSHNINGSMKEKQTKNVNLSRHNSIRSNNSHFMKIFTNNNESSNLSASSLPNQQCSPVPSPIDGPHYTLSSGGENDPYQNAQYSPTTKKRFPINIKRKFSFNINSITGNHSANAHRDHGKVTRDFN